jgi:hypothetical protein
MALFLFILGRLALKQGTDIEFLPKLKIWTRIEVVLFVAFLVLVYTWSGYYIPYGAMYILSLSMVLIITIRMRKTIEAVV